MDKTISLPTANGGHTEKERWLLGLLIFVLTFSFSLLYLNRYVVDNFLWNEYNSILFRRGLMPYRDFFVYVTPALLIKNTLLWFGFGETILGMVLAGLFERSLMFVLIYVMFSRRSKPLHAFIATLFSFLAILSGSFDTIGDYSWMCMMLTMLTAFCLQEFFSRRDRSPMYARIFLALAFFFAFLDIMTKQSNGLILTCAVLALMIIYTVCDRFQHALWDGSTVLIGLTVSAAPWLIWLGANDAIVPFFEQVFGSALNSKGVVSGDGASTLIKSLLSIFTLRYSIIFALALAIFLVNDFYKGAKKNLLVNSGVGCILLLLLLEHLVSYNKDLFSREQRAFTLLFLVGGMAITFLAAHYLAKQSSLLSAVAVSTGFTIAFAAVTFPPVGALFAIPTAEAISYTGSIFSHAALMICLALCARFVLLGWLNKATCAVHWSDFALVVSAMALAFGALLGSGEFNYMGSVIFVATPFILLMLLGRYEHISLPVTVSRRSFRISPHRILLCICATLICLSSTVVMADKMRSPYVWWGVDAGAISDSGSYTVDYDMFNGYLVSKETKVRYEQIGKLIEENSAEDDFILTFPYSVIYKIATERYEAPTKVSVYFFDVCSDDMARSDLEIIKANPPKIIVWMDIGDLCWYIHEFLFRDGNRMGQRDIQDWFNRAIETDYELIGNVGNQYVYRLKDGTPINYTYFATPEDTASNIDEVKDNVRQSHYMYKLSTAMLGEQGFSWLAIYVPLALLLLLLLALAVWRRISVERILILLFGSLYLLLPCKPALLCVFVFPAVLLLAKPKSRANAALAALGLACFALALLGWWSIWNLFVQYVVLGLILLQMLSIVIDESTKYSREKAAAKVQTNTAAAA